jgi:hypothetical protein
MCIAKKTAAFVAIVASLFLAGAEPAWGRDRIFNRTEKREGLRDFFKRFGAGRDEVIAAPNGNTGINGSGLPNAKKRLPRPGRVIPAPNGNTGINGSGLPKPPKIGKRRPGRVVAAPNGNTGITGAGLPR